VKQYKQGDRVKSVYLGDGEVIEAHKNGRYAFAYTVLFANEPDVRYNGGHKVCLVFPADLSEIKEAKCKSQSNGFAQTAARSTA